LVKANLEQRIKEVGAEVTFNNLPKISGDIVQIPQVFQNLIVNALKFSSRSSTPKISIEAKEQGADWLFSVKDNGIGIPEAMLPNIFDPFFTTKDVGKGTGMGLSISRRLLQSHGGTLDASSEGLGKGSTFRIRLPNRPPVEMARAATVGTAPAFVSMVCDLIAERAWALPERVAIGTLPANHDVCPLDCCPAPQRPASPAGRPT
jgi:light-regulated signal transduction histidine kinase (bacteriophytochrome)